MSRVMDDETEHDLYVRRFTHHDDQMSRNLEPVKEAKRLLQGEPVGRKRSNGSWLPL